MKRFGVIHHSRNWVYDPSINRFDTLPEAEKYVKDFQGQGEHSKDTAEIVEFIAKHEATEIDHGIYGFKKSDDQKED